MVFSVLNLVVEWLNFAECEKMMLVSKKTSDIVSIYMRKKGNMLMMNNPSIKPNARLLKGLKEGGNFISFPWLQFITGDEFYKNIVFNNVGCSVDYFATFIKICIHLNDMEFSFVNVFLENKPVSNCILCNELRCDTRVLYNYFYENGTNGAEPFQSFSLLKIPLSKELKFTKGGAIWYFNFSHESSCVCHSGPCFENSSFPGFTNLN